MKGVFPNFKPCKSCLVVSDQAYDYELTQKCHSDHEVQIVLEKLRMILLMSMELIFPPTSFSFYIHFSAIKMKMMIISRTELLHISQMSESSAYQYALASRQASLKTAN